MAVNKLSAQHWLLSELGNTSTSVRAETLLNRFLQIRGWVKTYLDEQILPESAQLPESEDSNAPANNPLDGSRIEELERQVANLLEIRQPEAEALEQARKDLEAYQALKSGVCSHHRDGEDPSCMTCFGIGPQGCSSEWMTIAEQAKAKIESLEIDQKIVMTKFEGMESYISQLQNDLDQTRLKIERLETDLTVANLKLEGADSCMRQMQAELDQARAIPQPPAQDKADYEVWISELENSNSLLSDQIKILTEQLEKSKIEISQCRVVSSGNVT